MISAQDMHVQCGVAFAPAEPLLVPGGAMRRPMQDVAQDPQLAAGMPVQQTLQALQVFSVQHPASLTPLGFPLWAERLRGQFSNEDWRTRVQRAAQQLERRHGR
jgi:hypothetical protein